jgi:hypothetical protein
VLKMEICLHALNPTGMSMHATGPIFRHPLVKT